MTNITNFFLLNKHYAQGGGRQEQERGKLTLKEEIINGRLATALFSEIWCHCKVGPL
jgi:hypothetical protein